MKIDLEKIDVKNCLEGPVDGQLLKTCEKKYSIKRFGHANFISYNE